MFLVGGKYDVPCLPLTSAVQISAARHEVEVVPGLIAETSSQRISGRMETTIRYGKLLL
jgi:hypothetical protein